MRKLAVDYRKLRFNNLTSCEFRHLWLLLYWPIFGILFLYVERFHKVDSYYPMYSVLDDYIPFCEWFLIPYMLWFVFLIAATFYTLLFDIDAFKKYMYYIMITYTAALVIFFIFPNCQELRPAEFVRDNALTRFMSGFYEFDTNTNVCPSLHVIGASAVLGAALNTKGFEKIWIKTFFWISTFFISISTVFLKQHSIIDIIVAIPICVIAYCVVYLVKKPVKENAVTL